MEDRVFRIIEERGPLTGQELLEAAGADELLLWRTCRGSARLRVKSLGTRYLRLDRRIPGYARLSPSILREFFTYSVVGLQGEPEALDARVEEILDRIRGVSRTKRDLAFNVISSLSNQFQDATCLREQACFILAGDIVYDMAHDVPRPERSTGKPVNGSDMDIVIVVDDGFPKALVERLDNAVFVEKQRLLITPHLREEIDYVVKDLPRVREQIRFDSFKRMVACKILQEGTCLYGSRALFDRVKGMLREAGVDTRLRAMTRDSEAFRRDAEDLLLREDPARIRAEFLNLFYPAEESEEFE